MDTDSHGRHVSCGDEVIGTFRPEYVNLFD